MTLICPHCGSRVEVDPEVYSIRGTDEYTMPGHHEPTTVRTFARLDGDDASHFFDARRQCELSGARFTLEIRE